MKKVETEGEREREDTAQHKQAKNEATALEKPYVCTYPGCGSAYTSNSNLKRHEQAKHADNAAPKKK